MPECSRWNCHDLTLNIKIKKLNSGGSSGQCACQWRSQGLLTLAHAPVITTAESSVALPLEEHSLSFSLRRQRQRNSASGLLALTAVTQGSLASPSHLQSAACSSALLRTVRACEWTHRKSARLEMRLVQRRLSRWRLIGSLRDGRKTSRSSVAADC